MSDEAALLAAVAAAPDDDLPRLVYADWLDDRGQSERAEFIRVQCELARLAPDCINSSIGRVPVPSTDPRYPMLRRREAELFGVIGCPAPPADGLSYRRTGSRGDRPDHWYRRGFPDTVQLLDPIIVRNRDGRDIRLARSEWLTDDDIADIRDGRPPDDDPHSPLEAYGNTGWGGGFVTRLDCLSALGADGVRHILAIPGVERLRGISLGVGLGGEWRSGEPVIRRLPVDLFGGLREVEVWLYDKGYYCDDEDCFGWLRRNVFSASCPQLASLILGDWSHWFDADAAAALATWPPLARLTTLELHNCWHVREVADVLAASPAVASLRVLALDGQAEDDIEAVCVTTLASSPSLCGLRALGLSRNAMTSGEAEAIANSPTLRGLTLLDLGNNRIGSDGATALARSRHLCDLRTLLLADNGITDAAAHALAASDALRHVQTLDLRRNRISDAGCRALTARFGDRVVLDNQQP